MNRIKTTQRRVKQRTTLQKKRRDAYVKCTQAWKDCAKENKTELWTIYAKNHRITTNRKGTVTLTGWNWFVKINIYRIYNNLEPILTPPND